MHGMKTVILPVHSGCIRLSVPSTFSVAELTSQSFFNNINLGEWCSVFS